MLRSVLTTLACLALASAAHAAPPPPIGNWLTEGSDAVITTAMCGNQLCGYISGIPLAIPGEPIPTDYQHHSQCHLTIIYDGVPDSDDWKARILDPRDGNTYRVSLRVDPQGRLHVRGYIGIPLFGSSQIWTPFTAPLPADCRLRPLVPATPAPGSAPQ